MDVLRIDDGAVLRLADALQVQQDPLDAMVTRLQEAASRIATGIPDLDAQTKAAAGGVGQCLDSAAEAFRLSARFLDAFVEAVLDVDEHALAEIAKIRESSWRSPPSSAAIVNPPPGS